MLVRCADICLPCPCVGAHTTGAQLETLFRQSPELEAVVVIDNETPIGLLTRNGLAIRLGSRYGFSLYERRPIGLMIDTPLMLIDGETSIHDLADLVVSGTFDRSSDGFVVTLNGYYHGVITPIGLLRAVNTANAESTAALRAAADQLAKSEAATSRALGAKSEFLAMMSHEIRTPLNGILGLAHVLQQTKLKSDQAELVAAIVSSSDLLHTILCDVLDFSKIEAGKLQLESREVSVHDLISETRTLWLPKATEKGLALDFVLAADTPSELMGDVNRIKQILFNFISNALKFTQMGRIVVAVGYVDGQLELKVTDDGPGIAHEVQQRLFQPFEQAEASTTRTFGGTGLGLAICRRLADLMQGDIGVNSEPGRGASFWVRLPMGVSVRHGTTDSEACDERPSGGPGLKVLAAEDNAMNRVVLGHILGNANMLVTFAEDGQEAVARAAERPFDLILMDLHMPKLDGIAAARAIRSQPGPNQHTPMIALTADAMANARSKCMAVGMSGFAEKPIRPSVLLGEIVRVLNGDGDDEAAAPAA